MSLAARPRRPSVRLPTAVKDAFKTSLLLGHKATKNKKVKQSGRLSQQEQEQQEPRHGDLTPGYLYLGGGRLLLLLLAVPRLNWNQRKDKPFVLFTLFFFLFVSGQLQTAVRFIIWIMPTKSLSRHHPALTSSSVRTGWNAVPSHLLRTFIIYFFL